MSSRDKLIFDAVRVLQLRMEAAEMRADVNDEVIAITRQEFHELRDVVAHLKETVAGLLDG